MSGLNWSLSQIALVLAMLYIRLIAIFRNISLTVTGSRFSKSSSERQQILADRKQLLLQQAKRLVLFTSRELITEILLLLSTYPSCV